MIIPILALVVVLRSFSLFRFIKILLIYLAFFSYPTHATDDLEQLSLEQLMNVTITGASRYEQKPQQIAASAHVITRNDIRAYGWRTLNEALVSLPGIYGTYDHQYNYLGVRGFSVPGDFTTRVLIMINGNRINDATYDQGPTGRDFPLDIDLIERIEYIPGPGSSVYGQNAMLGVVNVITRNGSSINGMEVSASYQTAEVMPQERVTFGRNYSTGLDALISVSGLQARGANRLLDFGDGSPPGIVRGQDGEDVKQLFARAVYGPFEFDFTYGNRRKDDPVATYLSDPLTDGQYQRDRRLNTQLLYNDNFFQNQLNVLGRLFLGEYRYYGPYVFSGERTLVSGPSNWHGAELRLLSTAITDHKLMLGFEYQNNTSIRQSFENFDNPASNILIKNSVLRLGVYIQDEWQITDSLSVTAGLRYDHNNWIGSRLSPRGALVWQATPTIAFKGQYGRAHRAPNAYERDYEDGAFLTSNPGLRSESVDAVEFTAEYQPLYNMNLRATIYEWDMRNIITLGIDSITELAQYQQTSGKARARGTEFLVEKVWDGGTRLRSSFGYQSTKQHGSILTNSPHFLGKFNFTTPIPLMKGMRAGYELQFFGKRKTLDGSYTDNTVLSNLNVMTDVSRIKGLQASLSIYNLFNENYVHPGSDNNWQNVLLQPGRTVRFRLDYRF